VQHLRGDLIGEFMAIPKFEGSRIAPAEGESVRDIMRGELREPSTTTEIRSPIETSIYRSVAELAGDIGLSERSTRAALRRGEIPHIRIGRRFILPRVAIADWLRAAGRGADSGQSPGRVAKLAVLGSPR
jgi:excisionase family DNA binding protein